MILLSTTLAPIWVLLLCPLLFGIPHVLGDLWVLFLRPNAPRTLLGILALPLLAMTGLRLRYMTGGPLSTAGELACGLVACVFAAWWGKSPARALLVGLLALPVLRWPTETALCLGHAHNIVAIWFLLQIAPKNVARGVATVFGLGMLVILAGGLDGRAMEPAGGLTVGALAKVLAPGVEGVLANRVVLSFGFAQAFHYLCWVALMPTHTAAQGQIGRGLLILGGVGTAGLLMAAYGHPAEVRAGYLSVVLFHGWLELGILSSGISFGEPSQKTVSSTWNSYSKL